MSWLDDYKGKLSSLEEAVSVVRSKDRVYISGNAAAPCRLMEALAERRDELDGVEVTHVLLLGDDPPSRPDMEGHFGHNSLFIGPGDRRAVRTTSPSSYMRYQISSIQVLCLLMWPLSIYPHLMSMDL